MNLLDIKNTVRPIADLVDPDRRMRNVLRNVRKARSPAVSASEGNAAIKQALSTRQSLLVGRVGLCEMKVVNRYLLRRRLPLLNYSNLVRRELQMNAGFHPISDDSLDQFAKYHLDCIADIDIFCAWFIPGETRIIKESEFETITVLPALEPFCWEEPWSLSLRNRTVLVVTPFVDTIRLQLDRLRLVWGYELFPGVEFRFVRFPHSQLLVNDESCARPWFDILKEIQAEIDSISFDVGFVGAGAATLPLARHMKKIGRTGIAMGGALQLLFGIRGRRWDLDPRISRYFNQYWIRPLDAETPPKFRSIENGAYW